MPKTGKALREKWNTLVKHQEREINVKQTM